MDELIKDVYPERYQLDVKIIKKDNVTKVPFNTQKVLDAVTKSAKRMNYTFSGEEKDFILSETYRRAKALNKEEISVAEMHNIAEMILDSIDEKHNNEIHLAKSYRDYRNYKEDFVKTMDDVYQQSQKILYIGDKENANTESALVSSKRSLILNALETHNYENFFLTPEEKLAASDGYIYIHDKNARRLTMNCCLFDIKEVLSGGFEMGNVWYNEPKTLDVAFDVIGDIVMSSASQQYGGFTLPEIDKVLVPYAKKSYELHRKKYEEIAKLSGGEVYEEGIHAYAMKELAKEVEQGFQGWEYKFNTVSLSRGDYPFITITFGLDTSELGKLISITCLNVRKNGQGKKGHKKPVLFPKLVFLYDENIHGEGKISEDVFNAGVECSMKTMYPDWLSMSGEGYISSVYKQYGKVISPMGCRAFLSPWFERGGMYPEDEEDVPVYVGRFNIGAVSLNLPMILQKSRVEGKNFYEVLDYYLEMIRQLHLRTYSYLGNLKASTNPLAYCEGGFFGGHLNPGDKIKPLLDSATASFGVTALNELQMLYNHKSLVEDGEFALNVMDYINHKISEFKEEDGRLYAIYGTPAENLCGKQIKQFRAKYGIIEGVSDREYVSNSFHCHVSENISPIQKQDLEGRFWEKFNGGKIQYVKYPINYNREAVVTLIRRAMKKGFYEGVNLSLAYCDDCGHEELEMDVCPVCGSRNLTKIDRMNGYLAYSRVHGDTRLNDAKMAEIKDRVSM